MWPKTSRLLPVWPRDAKWLGTPGGVSPNCISVLKASYLLSAGEQLRGGFQQSIHQLARYIFNMLMRQNEHMGGVGNILWSATLFYFYFGSVWLLVGFLLFAPLALSVLGLSRNTRH